MYTYKYKTNTIKQALILRHDILNLRTLDMKCNVDSILNKKI